MQHIQLQRSLKFTVDDLRANREGRMSEGQNKKNKQPEVNKLALIVIAGHAVLVVGLLGSIALITGKMAMWIVVGIVLALGLLPFLLMNNEGNINPTLRGDIKKGIVKKACGIVFINVKTGRNDKRSYELYVDGVTLKLNSAQAGAFIHEQDYCVYYLPLSKTLLSAEPYDGE